MKIYIHYVAINVIAIITMDGKNRKFLCTIFLSTLLRHSTQVCTMEKHASLLHLFRNWCTKSFTLNQPSLCTKHTNLLLLRETWSNTIENIYYESPIAFELASIRFRVRFPEFFQQNNCHKKWGQVRFFP